jgi:hypothetical protein
LEGQKVGQSKDEEEFVRYSFMGTNVSSSTLLKVSSAGLAPLYTHTLGHHAAVSAFRAAPVDDHRPPYKNRGMLFNYGLLEGVAREAGLSAFSALPLTFPAPTEAGVAHARAVLTEFVESIATNCAGGPEAAVYMQIKAAKIIGYFDQSTYFSAMEFINQQAGVYRSL